MSADTKMVGYKMTRPSCPGWMFLGTSPNEIGKAIACEIEMQEGLPPDECGELVIEPFWITQKEIDEMPEFSGW